MEEKDEYEIEESLMVVELQGIMETGFLGLVKQAKVLGIDTANPMLQLDDYTFSGEFQDSMGTCLLLEDITEEDDEEKKLEYSFLTNKKLCMQRVFLKESTSKSTSQEQTMETSTVDPVDQDGQKTQPETPVNNASKT